MSDAKPASEADPAARGESKDLVFATETKPELGVDDGKPWGFIAGNGVWVQVPKRPLLEAGFGPAPFDVRLPYATRRIVHRPGESSDA
jgi:hypothetical protein